MPVGLYNPNHIEWFFVSVHGRVLEFVILRGLVSKGVNGEMYVCVFHRENVRNFDILQVQRHFFSLKT